MSVYQLKSEFQNKLRPISDALVANGFTANQVTVSAIVLSAGTAYIITHIPTSTHDLPRSAANNINTQYSGYKQTQKYWYVLPVSLFLRMALNAIDGMMAREHNQASTLGAVLNELGDMLSDTLLINSLKPNLIQLAHTPSTFNNLDNLNHGQSINQSTYRSTRLLNQTNTLSLTTELIAVGCTLLTGERANHGPLGKSDRALELGLIGMLAGLGKPFNLPLVAYRHTLLSINQFLLLKTCFNRLSYLSKRYFELTHPAPESNHTQTTSNLNIVNTPIHTDTNNKESVMSPSLTQSSHLASHQSNKNHIIADQSCYNAYDGTAIYYRYWLTKPLQDIKNQSSSDKSDNQAEKHTYNKQKQAILLHRGHEHSGRLSELGEQYAKAGYQVFAWDARGNGRSGGLKDHANSVTQLERDLNDFVNLVISQTGIAIEDTIIVASSIGAVLAAAWVHDYAPTIRGMILGTPALSIRLYIPMAIPALKIARKIGLMSRVSSYVKAQVLTHDKEAQQAYNDDPLISGSISSDLLIDTHATGQRLLDDAGAITVPTFVLCAGKDYVVDKQAERQFYESLATSNKRWQLYPDSFHAIFHETNKADVFNDCIEFSESLFNQPLQEVDLTQAHINSDSKDKVDRLAIKPFNPSFMLTRLAMQKFGHVSDAIATGLEHGFDSGSSLDKVYENKPKGSNAIGKAIDKFYLSNIGWQGIRIRRKHLLELATIAIQNISIDHNSSDSISNETVSNEKSSNRAIKLLDIASGNGYYVFDLLKANDSLEAELRDYDTHNVTVMQEKALQLNLSTRVNTIKKDAFDPASYINSNKTTHNDAIKETQNPKADSFDIAIASGVFELFSDNTLVNTAIQGIFNSLNDGGYFIYTNQPWHPEQEFISKTLNNHRGSNWVMRCRSQAEMDQLVTQAGFEKIDMRIDRFGIFTVSLAKKPSNKSKDAHNESRLDTDKKENNQKV